MNTTYKVHNPNVFELYYKKVIKEGIYNNALNSPLDFVPMLLASEEWTINEV